MQESGIEPASTETGRNGEDRRPSLNERLMMAPSTLPPRSTVVPPAATTPPAESPTERETPRPAPERRPALNLNPQSPVAAVRPQIKTMEDALRQARLFARIRFYVYIASVAAVFAILVVSAIVLGLSITGDIEWERAVVSGVVGAVALVALFLLQYRVAEGLGADSFRLGEVGIALEYLQKSSEYWEQYLGDRDAAGTLTNQDVDAAVASLSGAIQGMMAIDAQRYRASRRGSQGKEEPAPPRVPTPAMPDPRRY